VFESIRQQRRAAPATDIATNITAHAGAPCAYGKRLALVAAIGLACMATAPGISLAQGLSGNSMRLIIPYTPGGSTDIVGRGIAQRITQLTGKNVIVENKPGAGGVIGTETVVRAAKDGNTLLLHTGTIVVEKAADKKLPYEMSRDLTPITMLAIGPLALVVSPDLPAKSMGEIVAMAKASPGKLNYSSAGIGTSTHLAMELFKQAAGVDIVHVPYKGGAPSLTAVASQEVQMTFSPLVNAKPFHNAGRIRAIANSTNSRSELWPELPSSSESGVKDFSTAVWYGLFTTGGIPQAVLDQLSADLRKILQTEETKQWFRTQGLEAVGDTPAQFTQKMDEEIAALRALIQRANLKLD